MTNCAVIRTTESMQKAQQDVLALRERFRNIGIDDKGQVFNSDLMEALEVGFMIDYSLVQIAGALARKESRGAHDRQETQPDGTLKKIPPDYEHWNKHTFAYLNQDGSVRLEYRAA